MLKIRLQSLILLCQCRDFFNKGTFKDYFNCIIELEKAEKLIGNTSDQIMDLKTQAWVKLVLGSKSVKFIYVVDTCIKKFFMLANVNTYPEAKYFQMIKVKNQIEDYKKKTINPAYSVLYKNDHTGLIDTELINLFEKNLKPSTSVSFVNNIKDISILKPSLSTLDVLYEDEGKSHFAIPFKTGDKGGYLFWYFATNNKVSCYMGYKETKMQKQAVSEEESGFFESFAHNYELNIGDKGEAPLFMDIIIQQSAIFLKPNTEYYMWFSSKNETEPFKVFYSMYLTDTTDKLVDEFIQLHTKKKNIRKKE